jgi:hypothetical protein
MCAVNKLSVFLFIKIRSGILLFSVHACMGINLFLLELEIRSELKKINILNVVSDARNPNQQPLILNLQFSQQFGVLASTCV